MAKCDLLKKSVLLDDLSSGLVGVSGEYFVAAELSRLGYVASVTLRNTRGIDVLATNADASRSVGIQVKTNRGKKKNWMLNQKAELYHSKNLFYVFVNLKGRSERPDYHIVPSKVVADFVRKDHREWLTRPDKAGNPHNDSPIRHFLDPENKYLDNWKSLRLDIAAG